MTRISRPRKNEFDQDDNTSDAYAQGAQETEAHFSEHENAVTRSGQTPAPADGTGEDLYQTGRAMLIAGISGQTFQDNSVAADSYELTPLTGETGLVVPDAYSQLEGAIVSFKVANAPTGASTVQIGQTTGTYLSPSKKLVKNTSTPGSTIELSGGEFAAGEEIQIRYDLALESGAGAWVFISKSITSTAADLTPSENVGSKGLVGFEISNNGSDAAHDIDMVAGICADATDAFIIERTSSITKQIDANWAVGSGNGGFPSGLTLSGTTWYHFFIIAKTDGTTDAGFDTNLAATNLLTDATGYTLYRRVGAVYTDGSENITAFTQIEDYFYWNGDTTTAITPSLSFTDLALQTPLGVKTKPYMRIFMQRTSTDSVFYIKDKNSGREFITAEVTSVQPERWAFLTNIFTDTSSKIQHKVSIVAISGLDLTLIGYYDSRGKV